MPKNFFILGHARSRTAWLSTFFSSKHVYCYHEALRHCKSVEDYKQLMGKDDYTYVGDSDNAAMNLDIGKFFPNSSTVFIKRRREDVVKSLKKLFPLASCDLLVKNFDQNRLRLMDVVSRCPNALEVEFEDINDRLEEMWHHCVGDVFDVKRAEHLVGMNIQTQQLRYKTEVM